MFADVILITRQMFCETECQKQKAPHAQLGKSAPSSLARLVMELLVLPVYDV
jgi:hypothetical protein